MQLADVGCDTTANYGMGLVPIFCLWISVFSIEKRGHGWSLSTLAIMDGRTAAVAQVSEQMTSEELTALLAPTIADLGLELVGIEFSPNSGSSLLRVYIDEQERGVTIDDCERASREISALLDVNDPVAGRYTLEVSSPGLERPLFTPEHFARFVGEQAKVNVNLPLDGRRRFRGAIRSVEGDRITLDQDGVPIVIVHANIAKARLVPDYAALGIAPEKRDDAPARPPKRARAKS
jgi:ribosome maturation factor RimP